MQLLSVLLTWTYVPLAALIALIAVFCLVVPATFVLWVRLRLRGQSFPTFALYDLDRAKELSSVAVLDSLLHWNISTQIRWTEVHNVGPHRQTWRIRSVFVTNLTDKGPYLLLVHGTASGAMVWTPLWRKLSQRFRIVAVDLPGFGQSPTPPKLYSTPQGSLIKEMYVDALAKFIEQENLESITLLGHSFGAYISVPLAKRLPARIDTVILASAVGLLPTLDTVAAHWGIFFKLSPVQGLLMRGFRHAATWIAYTWFRYMEARPDAYYWYQVLGNPNGVGDLIVSKPFQLDWVTGQAYWSDPVIYDLLHLKCKLAFIYGERDSITPAHQGQFVAKLLGSAVPCVEIENIGHNIAGGSHENLLKAFDCAYSLAARPEEHCQHLLKNLAEERSHLMSHVSTWSLSDTGKVIDRLYSYLDQTKNQVQ